MNMIAEAQKQLLNILANRLIHIAEAASLFRGRVAKARLTDNAIRQRRDKAVFECKPMIDGGEEQPNSHILALRAPISLREQQRRFDIDMREPTAQWANSRTTPWREGVRELILEAKSNRLPLYQSQRASETAANCDPWTHCSDRRDDSGLTSREWGGGLNYTGLEPYMSQSTNFPSPEHNHSSQGALFPTPRDISATARSFNNDVHYQYQPPASQSWNYLAQPSTMLRDCKQNRPTR